MRPGRKLEDAAAIGGLLALNALYFLPVLVQGNGVVLSSPGTDTWGQFYFWRHFAYERLASGELPLWNPYVFSGSPFVAGIQSAIFYPLNLIHLLAPTAFAINFNIALHCFLASLFTYLYARRLGCSRCGASLSGISFAYGAPYFLHVFAGHLPHLSTMIWLPLLFLGLESFLETGELKYAVGTGIALALQLLAGFPQYVFYSVIAVSFYFFARVIARRRVHEIAHLLAGYALFVATGSLLAAVQLLPAAEFTKLSFRESLTYEWVSIFSLPPENLVTLLIPDFFGNRLSVPYWGKNYLWEMSVYLGAVSIALAIAAVVLDRQEKVRCFAWIAFIALVLALGKYTPLLKILFNLVPGFDRFRGLSKFVVVFSFAMALLAGLGLSKLTSMAEAGESRRLRQLGFAMTGFAVLLFLFVVAGPFLDADRWQSLIESYGAGEPRFYALPAVTDALVRSAISAAFRSSLTSCGVLALLGLYLAIFSKKKELARFLPVILLFLAALDLWHFGSRYLVTFSPKELRVDQKLRDFLTTDREPYRIASPLEEFLNVGLYEKIENIGGYDTLVLKRYSEFINFARGLPLDEPSTAIRMDRFSPLLDLLNVRYLVLDAAIPTQRSDLTLAFQSPRYHVYLNHRALPRSYIVHEVRPLAGRDEIMGEFLSPTFRPSSVAVVEEPVESFTPHPSAQSPPPRFLERSPTRILLEAELNAPGLLVLSDVFYPDWKCSVDGKETKIYRTNYIMRGVVVPAGKHRVEFSYDPRSFKIGAAISLTTLVVVSAWLIWGNFKRSKT